MRNAFALFLLLLTQTISFGQIIQKEDGLYYNEDNTLYSGTYIEFYTDGIKRIELNLLKGKKEGPTILYNEEGNIIEERSFSDNEKDGTWKTYNSKGIQIAEANYTKGQKDGKWFIWNDQGKLLYDMTYEKGEKSGTWIIFKEDGTIQSSKKY